METELFYQSSSQLFDVFCSFISLETELVLELGPHRLRQSPIERAI